MPILHLKLTERNKNTSRPSLSLKKTISSSRKGKMMDSDSVPSVSEEGDFVEIPRFGNR